MKRLLSTVAAAALLTATLGSCRSHTTDETYQAGGNGNPETTAQQEQLSPRVDAPNNAGMADSAGNASGAGTTGGSTTGTTGGTTSSMGTTGGSTTGSTGGSMSTTGSN
ncbi:hypothetical protein H8B15_13225 [Hymenobacter sp. BT507]|uniref:Uncharacterized protein n=1 Tax=Hymenobacter citatus TaxID=2763506 RepID=A0ABR7MLC6_9BACT|nr:hypothetical protein [Hymenobacter citatus]MBC6611889.1 hypothetical protein [Hymenobacter citatus]